MKLKLSIFLFLFLNSTFIINAQTGNSTLEIFSENGDPFVLVMNGIQQNKQAQTNVKIENLAMAAYKIRVIFQNTELGALNDKINLDFGAHQSYAIKKKKISSFQKNLKTAGNNMAENFSIKDSTEANAKRAEIENQDSKFVIRLISKVPTVNDASYQQTPPPPPSQSGAVRNNTQVTTTTAVPAHQTTVVQQTTTTTGNTAGVSSSTNMGGANVNMNINLGGGVNAAYSETTTTSTTVQSTGGAPVPQQNVYVLPGYSGPTGCPWPMSEAEFSQAKNSIKSKSFEDSKLTMAKQIFNHNCLLSSQVRDMINLFDFEATKLEFAKYAYGRTFDIGNYYKVNDAFEFESSISDLNNYINSYRR